ncbi:hypothetical protein MD484_g5789, partial [Candolleomyces efflorescens]
MTLSQAPSWNSTSLESMQLVAALTFLLYDIMITYDDEVRLIWSNPWSLTKCIYFFIRYFPVVLQITIMFLGTPPFTFTHYECYIWNVYQALASALVVACVDYILILRVFALYPRNATVKYFLGGVYLLELIAISVCMGLAVPKLVYDEMCVVVAAPVTFLIAAGAPIAFQTLLFGMTFYKFFQAVKAGWGDIPIMHLLMRDGTWAFILLFAVLIGEAALYGFAPDAYTGVLYGWLNTTFSFCGYRVLLNLNKLNVSQRRPSAHTTGTGDVVLSTHFDFGPVTIDDEYEMTSFAEQSRRTQGGVLGDFDATEDSKGGSGSSSSWTSPPNTGKLLP